MKRLKVEYTAFDFQDYSPRKSFFDDLSRKLTPRILDAITVEDIRNNATKVVCLSIDINSYLSPKFLNGTNSMRMNIAGYSAPLIICTVEVFWQDEDGNQVFPWEDIKKEVRFDIQISKSERKKLNQLLPQIYHPVIKPEKSGLPFEYQVFYGGDTMTFYFAKKVCSNTISEIHSVVREFIENWNTINNCKIHGSELLAHTDTRIRMRVDFGGANNAAEALIRSFNTQKDIKKIVLR